MSTLYISLCSQSVEDLGKRIVAECESFLKAKCFVKNYNSSWSKEAIREKIGFCDVLIIVIDDRIKTLKSSIESNEENSWEQRIRIEIISAMDLDLLIIPLLVNDAEFSGEKKIPGTLKRLFESKSYRLREASWCEDLPRILSDIQEELDFKREVEEKISKLNQPNFLGLADSEGKPLRADGLGLRFSSALETRRVIESERVNLEDARRRGDLMGENKSLSVMSLAFTQLGQTRKAIQLFEEQLKVIRKLGDADEELSLLANLGDAFAVSGEIERAGIFYKEQLLLADSAGNSLSIASALNGLGFISVKQNKISRAIEFYSKALKIYQEIENHEKELELLVGIGLNYQKMGQLEKTTDTLEEALRTAKYLENRKEEAKISVDLGEIYFYRKNFERINAYLNRAEEIINFREESWVGPLKQRLFFLRESMRSKK